MGKESREKERASNIIWNAADDYSFQPGIKAYDESGKADLYLNYIIGAVHKYYDYSLIQSFLDDLEEDSSYEILENLMWIGLENCTFERGKSERPVLESLRRSYAKRILSKCNAASANYILDEINIAHFQRALGEEPKMTGLAFSILKDLEFDKSMDTGQIIHKMNEIIKRYFGLGVIPSNYGKKRKPHRRSIPSLKLFKIASAQHSGGIDSDKKLNMLDKLVFHWLKFIELRNKHQREYIQNYYGSPILSESSINALEKALCDGNHRNCHLHFTRGEFNTDTIINRDTVNHRNAVVKQREKNEKYYKDNLARNNAAISRLTNRIKNTIMANFESFNRSKAGKLAAGRVWRSVYLNDNRIFIKSLIDDVGGLSIDLMLDASSSLINRQEIIAAEGFIIAESLTICRIPTRVYSFCSQNNYTVVNLFRDYGEIDKNDKIFNYNSTGCNRDGLAIRAALHMMKDSAYEHKILIILSDGVPNDMQCVSAGKLNRVKYDYTGTLGVNDTALEVRKGLRNGVSILCVFTGHDRDLPDAKKIYGRNIAHIKSQDRFADTVGVLIQNELKSI